MNANDLHRLDLIAERKQDREPRCLNASRGCEHFVRFHGLYCPSCDRQQQAARDIYRRSHQRQRAEKHCQ